MSANFPPDVEAMVADQLATGRYGSRDDVLRDALQALADLDQDVAAVQEAIDAWESGVPDVPMDEAFRRIRASIDERNPFQP